MKRSIHQAAFVLHRYDWSESSLILDVLTRDHGRVALVAKGAKRPTSSFRAVLLPLQPLAIHYGGEGDVRTLKAADWVGGHVMPTGEALLSGLYLNELLIRLLARDDAHADLFDHYAQAVGLLAGGTAALSVDVSTHAVLRSFELLLLRAIGVLPDLSLQTLTQGALAPEHAYTLVPEGGLRHASAHERSLRGRQWLALQVALDSDQPFLPLLPLVEAVGAELKAQLRQLLHYHCGVAALSTRRVMMELHNL